MHMIDAYLSVPVGASFWGISGLAVGAAAHRFARDERQDQDPALVGVMAAFVFAAQMINVAIPGTGSSGHLAGSTLLAILLGPARAILCIAAVLLVQALFFYDGGIIAFGCNLFNMGLVGALGGWTIYRLLAGGSSSYRRRLLGGGLAAWCAVVAGAAMVPLQVTLSGRADLPFLPFLSGMVLIHMAIGILEGGVTAAVIAFLLRNRPTLFFPPEKARVNSLALLTAGLGLVTLVLSGILYLFASALPDGLEFTLERFQGESPPPPTGEGFHRFFTDLQESLSFLPDYQGRWAGVVGSLLLFAALGGGLWLRRALRRDPER